MKATRRERRGKERRSGGVIVVEKVGSQWVERTMFAIGSLLVFLSQVALDHYITGAKEKAKYFERGIQQIQVFDGSKDNWLAEYNRAVTASEKNYEVIAHDAFHLAADFEQILTMVKVLTAAGNGLSGTDLIDAKNVRVEELRKKLFAGQYDSVIARAEELTEENERTVEPLTKEMMGHFDRAEDSVS